MIVAFWKKKKLLAQTLVHHASEGPKKGQQLHRFQKQWKGAPHSSLFQLHAAMLLQVLHAGFMAMIGDLATDSPVFSLQSQQAGFCTRSARLLCLLQQNFGFAKPISNFVWPHTHINAAGPLLPDDNISVFCREWRAALRSGNSRAGCGNSLHSTENLGQPVCIGISQSGQASYFVHGCMKMWPKLSSTVYHQSLIRTSCQMHPATIDAAFGTKHLYLL